MTVVGSPCCRSTFLSLSLPMRLLLVSLCFSAASTACSPRTRGLGVAQPQAESPAAQTFQSVTASAEGVCALRSDATLWCWGHNAHNSLGLGERSRILSPEQVGPLDQVVAVAPGSDHTCALRADRSLYCVGDNSQGQLGTGDTTSAAIFAQVEGSWQAVAVGTFTTCGIKIDGSLWCWGAGTAGKRPSAQRPTRLGTETNWSGFESIAAGRKADGSVAMFGAVPKVLSDYHCAVHADKTLWCWGDDLIADGATYSAAAPYVMSQDTDWNTVTTGTEHACALKVDGRVFCWGANSFGQLGIGVGPDSTSYQRLPRELLHGLAKF